MSLVRPDFAAKNDFQFSGPPWMSETEIDPRFEAFALEPLDVPDVRCVVCACA